MWIAVEKNDLLEVWEVFQVDLHINVIEISISVHVVVLPYFAAKGKMRYLLTVRCHQPGRQHRESGSAVLPPQVDGAPLTVISYGYTDAENIASS